MLDLFIRVERPLLIFCALGLAVLIVWWTALTSSEWSTRQLLEQAQALVIERDQAVAKHQELQQLVSELVEKNEKLAASREEHGPKAEVPEAKPLFPVPGTLHVLAKGRPAVSANGSRENRLVANSSRLLFLRDSDP